MDEYRQSRHLCSVLLSEARQDVLPTACAGEAHKSRRHGLYWLHGRTASQAFPNPPSVRGEEILFVPRPVASTGFPIRNPLKPDEEQTKRDVLRYAVRIMGCTYMHARYVQGRQNMTPRPRRLHPAGEPCQSGEHVCDGGWQVDEWISG